MIEEPTISKVAWSHERLGKVIWILFIISFFLV